MKYEIRNVADRLLSILLNSGGSTHLGPGLTAEFLEAEIINNPSVTKLESLGLIRCKKLNQQKGKTASAGGGEKKATSESAKKVVKSKASK